jgi:hypothetical protein
MVFSQRTKQGTIEMKERGFPAAARATALRDEEIRSRDRAAGGGSS